MTSYGMEYSSGHFGSAVLAVFLPTSWTPPVFLLAEHKKLKYPWLNLNPTAKVSALSALTLSSKNSTVPAARKEISSIPAEIRPNGKIELFCILVLTEPCVFLHWGSEMRGEEAGLKNDAVPLSFPHCRWCIGATKFSVLQYFASRSFKSNFRGC